jgi:hypothetical protein
VVSLADLLRPRRPTDVGLSDPDPTIRLAFWRNLIRQRISIEVCADLARQGFPELARELMRLRGAP